MFKRIFYLIDLSHCPHFDSPGDHSLKIRREIVQEILKDLRTVNSLSVQPGILSKNQKERFLYQLIVFFDSNPYLFA